jgi:chromosomal replication initiation ATPase DnaA
MNSNTETWEEVLGDQVFVFQGKRDSSDHSKRAIVEIRSRAPLLKRQIGARIPPTYREALLSTWNDGRSNPGTKAIVHRYVASPVDSVYLYGQVGRGKTFTACAVGNELLRRGKAVRFETVSELLLDIRDTFSTEAVSEKSVLQPLRDVRFLILDELGDLARNRDRTASAFSASRILTLLDSRWRTGKPTILTSNLSLEELERWVDDPRIASRIAGMCTLDGVIEIIGRDLRCDQVPEEVSAP